MEKTKFIKTNDGELARKLEGNGFTPLGWQDGFFTFITDGKMTFSENDNDKIIYTNILSI